jgi:hypothetical protein
LDEEPKQAQEKELLAKPDGPVSSEVESIRVGLNNQFEGVREILRNDLKRNDEKIAHWSEIHNQHEGDEIWQNIANSFITSYIVSEKVVFSELLFYTFMYRIYFDVVSANISLRDSLNEKLDTKVSREILRKELNQGLTRLLRTIKELEEEKRSRYIQDNLGRGFNAK